MKEIFTFQENKTYNLRSGNQLVRKNIRATQYGIESVSNLGAKLWNLLPGKIQKTVLSASFSKIRLENDPWKMFISEKTFLKYK